MAGQNPAFYFYHSIREGSSLGTAPASSASLAPMFDGRQGEIFAFDDDFTTEAVQRVAYDRPDTPAADAIDYILIPSHNLTGCSLNLFTSGSPAVDMLSPNYTVTEAAGELIILPLTVTQDVAPDHERLYFQIFQGTAAGATTPELGEIFLTTKREVTRGPEFNWDHSWVRAQQQFVGLSGISSTWLNGAARKRYVLTWRHLSGADRQIMFDMREQTNDWSEPFYFTPPDDQYPTILVELERDPGWEQDFQDPLSTGTTDAVTLPMIQVLG